MASTIAAVRGKTHFVSQQVLIAAIAFAGVTTSFAAVPVKPDSRSPLASDGTNVFAVAEDRQTLIVSRPNRGQWSPLVTLKGADIRGLAWMRSRLYFSNAADASVQSIATVGDDRTPAVVHRGPPFVRPGELTYAGVLVAADAGAGSLFRIGMPGTSFGGDMGSAPMSIGVPIKITDATFITGWGYGEVVISDSDSGLLAQLTDVTGEALKFRALQQREPGRDTPVQWNQKSGAPETIRRREYPGVNAPGAIATHNGILYVIDARSGALFAAGIHDARAIRLNVPVADARFTRLVANSVALTALDAKTGQLVTWPRIVPSELTLLPSARPQSLFPVLEYLHRRKLLRTKQVTVSGTLDDTLTRERMVWPARGESVEVLTPQGHYASFCMLNPTRCANGLPNPDLPQGTTILLADLYGERFTAAIQVTLDGSRTLGQIVEGAIQSSEFESYKSEAYLRRINGLLTDDTRVLLEAVTGTFRITEERVRYVIPIEARELRPGDTEFKRLQVQVMRTIRIAPLERIMTSTAAIEDASRCDAQKCGNARAAFGTLLNTIAYAPVTPTRTIVVGVAEEAFDTTHRDFADPEGGPVWESFDEAVPQPVPTAPVSAGTAPDEHARVTWRDRNADDHGTAVAAIIGARTRLYADSPALTAPRLGMLTQSKEATALGFQIERALKDSPMTVINLSLNLKARLDTEKLRTVIEDAQSTALFVVAAPNSSQITLCARQEVWFPSCYGQLYRNVLVVGGTTLDGEHIHPTSPIGKDVHLFAPETGYFSAGRQNSYVPVEGTSFATALVSVAAAMLSSAGVTSPELIKQRLMATATVMEIPGRPQWARRLDIRRAVMFIGNSVMTDFGTGKERPVEVASRDDVLNFRTIIGNRALPVAVGDIRRLTRVEGNARGFELAYVVPGTNQLDFQAVQPPVTPWPFCYRPLNEKGQVSGERTCSDLAELKDYVGPIQ